MSLNLKQKRKRNTVLNGFAASDAVSDERLHVFVYFRRYRIPVSYYVDEQVFGETREACVDEHKAAIDHVDKLGSCIHRLDAQLKRQSILGRGELEAAPYAAHLVLPASIFTRKKLPHENDNLMGLIGLLELSTFELTCCHQLFDN